MKPDESQSSTKNSAIKPAKPGKGCMQVTKIVVRHIKIEQLTWEEEKAPDPSENTRNTKISRYCTCNIQTQITKGGTGEG